MKRQTDAVSGISCSSLEIWSTRRRCKPAAHRGSCRHGTPATQRRMRAPAQHISCPAASLPHAVPVPPEN
jgi:hypothetical protein